MDGTPFGDNVIECLKLATAYRSLQVGQAEVVADNVVPIALVLPHSVISENAAAFRKLIVSRQNHAPFTGGDRLGGVEAKGAGTADGPREAAFVAREGGLGGVLYHAETQLRCGGRDAVHFSDVAVEVNRHDC